MKACDQRSKKLAVGLSKVNTFNVVTSPSLIELSANTRKEEIERFKRAKDDEDFRKMLKARTLGPELLELKSRLRGELMRKKQEVMKLEEVLKENKKKMTAMKNQKGVFRFVHLFRPASVY